MKQVYLDEETHQELKARAALAGVKMGVLIRQLLGLPGESGGVNSTSGNTPTSEAATPPPPTPEPTQPEQPNDIIMPEEPEP